MSCGNKSTCPLLLIIISFVLIACEQNRDPVQLFNNGQYKAALLLWKPLARAGDMQAINYLGIHYYLGLGVKKDFAKAVDFFNEAARQGYPDAQYNLGIMYENGQYVKQDFSQAYTWLFAAHMQGNTHAQQHMKRLSEEHKLMPNQMTYAQKLAMPYIKKSNLKDL